MLSNLFLSYVMASLINNVECSISIAMLTVLKVIAECHFVSCHHTDSRGADKAAIIQSWQGMRIWSIFEAKYPSIFGWAQGDQKIGKNSPIFKKVAKTVAK